MSKYGDLIKKAREVEPENQETREPDNQTAINPENQKTRKSKNQIAVNTENQKTRKPDNQTTIKQENQSSGLPEIEQMVNLCVKVPISQRRYWMSKAKEQGITVTSVIVEALIQKFGEPENHK